MTVGQHSIDRFWARVDKSGDCWIWTGSKTRTGYGHIYFNQGNDYTHRVAYRLTKGEIPQGMFVCHACDNPPCCNPDHLWLGTATENIADREAKGRGRSGRKASTLKVTWDQAREFRLLYKTNEYTRRDLCSKFEISRELGRSIIRNDPGPLHDPDYTPSQETAKDISSKAARLTWKKPAMREMYVKAIRKQAERQISTVSEEQRMRSRQKDAIAHIRYEVKRARSLGLTEIEIRSVIDKVFE